VSEQPTAGRTPVDPALPTLDGLAQKVLRRALIKIRHFRLELDSLRSTYAEREDLPGVRTLIDAMSVVVAEAEREVTLLSRKLFESLQSPDADDDQATERFCDIVGGLVNALEYTLPNLLQTVREPHGREIEALTRPFTTLLENLAREEATIELIFEPDDDYAYDLSVIHELAQIAQQFTSSLRDLLNDLPQLVAITYPKHLEAETLGHVIIAHEIAHTVIDRKPPSSDEPPILEAFDEAVTDRFDDLEREIKESNPPEEDLIEEMTVEAVERARRWYQELVCDALALGLVGPVYAFALADFELASNRWGQIRGGPGYETHPGLTWRLRRLIDQARSEYLSTDSPGPAAATLSRGLDELKEALPSREDAIAQQERALIELALVNAEEKDAVSKVLGQARYLPEFLEVEGELVLEKLQAGIPPAERVNDRGAGRKRVERVPQEWSKPIKWQSIFNGAYAHWLEAGPLAPAKEDLRTLPERRTIAKDWIDFNSYIRGSIELANIHAELEEARERLGDLNNPEKI